MVLGQILTLTVEKPAAGGRMIGRIDGQVVLVAGAIPGERLTARVERIGKGVVYAQALAIEEASPDRRRPFTDPLCGGCLYAHIAYPRQLDIKSQVIADAFGRIGRLTLPASVRVAASPDEGYRMRARLHVRGRRVGFFREGTHEICDARATRQLRPETCDVLDRVAASLHALGVESARELEVSENLDASQRVVHLDTAAPIDARPLAEVSRTAGLSGFTITPQTVVAGDPYVTDVISIGGHDLRLRRHVLAFFQGNRFLLRDLVAHVAGLVAEGDQVVDLYAGTGLFSVGVAVARGAQVTAVEGDRMAALDLQANAVTANAAIVAVDQPVEEFTRRTQPRPGTVIVDPPRTGLSREAMDGVLGLGPRTTIYVSCDVATLARDARRLVDAGYALRRLDAFDLFPNTPHVETVVEFENLRT